MPAPARRYVRSVVKRAQEMYLRVCDRDGDAVEGWGALDEEERTVYLIAAWFDAERAETIDT